MGVECWVLGDEYWVLMITTKCINTPPNINT